MGSTDRRTANLLGALTVALGDEIEESLRVTLDLGETAAAALVSIATGPGTSVGDLAKVIGKEQSTTVRVVDRLETSGLVVRTQADDDARRVELRLTEEGRRSSERILEGRHEVLAGALGRLDDESRAGLHEILDRLLASMASSRERARNICRLCDHGVCRGSSCPVGRPFVEGDDESG